jgi:hypothetical protein
MKRFNILLLISFCLMIFLALSDQALKLKGLNKYETAPKMASKLPEDYQTTFVDSYDSNASEPSLKEIQCPVPKQNRVKNYTGIQCVYSSIEMLGRWAEESKLIDPPITSRSDCQGYSGPSEAARILNKLGVKFEQSYGNKEEGIKLLKKAMKDGRGALWGVPHHAMVIIHYSEKENKVCWVDNSDRELRIQQTTIASFNKRWNSWILVIYPDSDVDLNTKLNRNIPILDHNNNNKTYPKNFIPIPDTSL